MVIQATIDSLREKPIEHRRFVAFSIALGVTIVLFFFWAIFFLRSLSSAPELKNVGEAYDQARSQVAGAYESVQTNSPSNNTNESNLENSGVVDLDQLPVVQSN